MAKIEFSIPVPDGLYTDLKTLHAARRATHRHETPEDAWEMISRILETTPLPEPGQKVPVINRKECSYIDVNIDAGFYKDLTERANQNLQNKMDVLVFLLYSHVHSQPITPQTTPADNLHKIKTRIGKSPAGLRL